MPEQLQLSFSCDVDPDTPWIVTGVRLVEQFNRPFAMKLKLRSDDPTAEPVRMLGASVTVVFERDEFQREVHGIVAGVVDGRGKGESIPATLTVVPALEALRHRRNSRIFPDQSIKDTLLEVLEAGLGGYDRSVDVELLNDADYPVQEHTVQYQETDLAFVHRLMEEYGIGYRFASVDGVEQLVLFSGAGDLFPLSSLENEDGALPVSLLEGGSESHEDCREFARKLKLRSTVARTSLFDWLSDPSEVSDFENADAAEFDLPNGAADGPEREDYEHLEPATVFGYRSAGLDDSEADNQVTLRRELHQRDAQTFVGVSTASHMQPGAYFELLDHPQADLHADYYITKVIHTAGDFVDEDFGEAYRNQFEALPTSVAWRPDRKTLRPRIHGIQTATVVGPNNEEIHTDEHGRIKVQFHWDRRKQYNDNASCFLRVVQPWAGDGWGFVFLPRIGMEVAVTFIDGDPDRPVVTGSLYNGSHAPPYLPDHKTRSTIKTQSSPGGDGFNELRFEDAAGSEEIYVHAQRNYNEKVLSDHNTSVGNNQTNTVDVDQTNTIHGKQTETIDKTQDLTVTKKRTLTVNGGFKETINSGEERIVSGGVNETITGGETRKVTGKFDETITGNEIRKVTATVDETIVGGETRTVSTSMMETVNGPTTYLHHGPVTDTIDGPYTITATGGMNVTAPGGINITDPSKTSWIHSVFNKISGYSGEAVGFKFGVIGGKVEIVPGVAVGVVGVKLDMVGVKVDLYKVKFSNEDVSLKAAKTKLRNAAFGAYMYGLTLFM